MYTSVNRTTLVQPAIIHRSFTGDEEHRIGLTAAAKLTHAYQRVAGAGAVVGGDFGKAILERIIAQAGCVGIRAYFGLHGDASPVLVLSGVKANRNDLFEGVLGGGMVPVMRSSSPASPLNHDPSLAPQGDSRLTPTNLDHQAITLAEASQLTSHFRMSSAGASVKGGYFSRRIFSDILRQPGCVGVRFYFAMLEDMTATLVLVGANKNGADLAHGVIGEDMWFCPPWCGATNPLNR